MQSSAYTSYIQRIHESLSVVQGIPMHDVYILALCYAEACAALTSSVYDCHKVMVAAVTDCTNCKEVVTRQARSQALHNAAIGINLNVQPHRAHIYANEIFSCESGHGYNQHEPPDRHDGCGVVLAWTSQQQGCRVWGPRLTCSRVCVNACFMPLPRPFLPCCSST